jgi:hypothetical protein
MALYQPSEQTKDIVMTLTPKVPRDLALAPVAAEIDRKLQRLRPLASDAIEHALQLELDRPPFTDSRDERTQRLVAYLSRNVDLHGWDMVISDDATALHLSGGSVSLDLALGDGVHSFLVSGKAPQPA